MMSDKNGLPGGKHTLVEEGTEFKGTLSSKCPIVVMGKVEGDVTGPIIQVTASGVVAGNVKVKELRSEGELAGKAGPTGDPRCTAGDRRARRRHRPETPPQDATTTTRVT
jgi:hypothetical protein